MSELHPKLVERSLEKLGLSDRPSLDADGLASLYAAWCRGVPFDNVCKRIHVAARNPEPLPGSTPAAFLETWLRTGAGGTCWAGNGALNALLSKVGFAATRGVATMLVVEGLEPNHGTVSVAIEDRTFLVDASMLHQEPLELRPGERSAVTGAWAVEARPDGERWRVAWRGPNTARLDCRIETLASDAADFEARHEKTRAWSPFNFGLMLRTNRADSVLCAERGHRCRIDESGAVEQQPLEGSARTRFLVDEIGIAEELAVALPEDEPMRSPNA